MLSLRSSCCRQLLRRTARTGIPRSRLQYSSSLGTIPEKADRQPSKPTSIPASRVIFSGIQPTGVPHLGNYLGALREWVKIQDSSDGSETLLFSIVDLHAITIKQSADQLHQWRKQMLASFMAIGLDPTKSLLFCQSSVPEHAELMWILSCNASMGYLARMTQWKSKMSLPDAASPFDTSSASTSREATKLGLFAYPVLQAADILLYGTTHVPVGEDQAQHLEFSRQLANAFNHTIAPRDPVFVPPEMILSPAKRVMSLKDPSKKMSKSDPDPKSRILITDGSEDIKAKIKSALTDSIEGISYDPATRPGVSNLIDLMCYMDPSISLTPHEVAADMRNVSMRALKEKVANVVDHNLRDIRERYKSLMSKDASYLAEINERSALEARKIAQSRMGAIRTALGMGSLDS